MNAVTIKSVEFRKVFTNIGAASIEVNVSTQGGAQASTMRIDERLPEHDVSRAINALEGKVAPLLLGRDASLQGELDAALSDAASVLTAAAPFVPSVSQAVLEACAAAYGQSIFERLKSIAGLTGALPMPMSGAIAAGVNFGAGTTYKGKPWWGYIASGFDDADDAVNALWVTLRKWQELVKKRFGVKVSVHSGNLFYPDSFFATAEELCTALSQAIADAGFEGRVGLFLDLAADSRCCAKTGRYNGLLSQSATRDEHLDRLCGLLRDYPVAAIIDPLEPSDVMGYATLNSSCDIVCSKGKGSGVFANIFDEMTVSQAVGLATSAREKDLPFMAELSLSPGFKAMDYYAALEICGAPRCGMTDYANRALELSGCCKQKNTKHQKGGLF